MLNPDFEKLTARLVVRPYRAADYHEWRETLLNLPEAQNTWDMGPRAPEDLTREKFKALLQADKRQRDQDTYYSFIAFEQTTGRMVGSASLMDISRALFQNAYLGYRVHSPYWGMGYGREIARAVIEIGFHDLELHRIEAGVEPTNTRSIELAEALNMRYEGLSKRRLYLRGQWVDAAIYALTAEDMGIEDSVGKPPTR